MEGLINPKLYYNKIAPQTFKSPSSSFFFLPKFFELQLQTSKSFFLNASPL